MLRLIATSARISVTGETTGEAILVIPVSPPTCLLAPTFATTPSTAEKGEARFCASLGIGRAETGVEGSSERTEGADGSSGMETWGAAKEVALRPRTAMRLALYCILRD